MADILNSPAQAVDGQAGTTDTAVLVRFLDDSVVPVGVQVGRCASEYLSAYDGPGYKAVGVRQNGVTVDLEALDRESRRKAVALVLHVITYEDPDEDPDGSRRPAQWALLEADRVIAAYEGTARRPELGG